MKKGEIWWSDVPGLGRRPVLILTRDTAIPILTNLVVALLTTTVREIPTEVVLEESDGLPSRCVISLDNIHTVSKRHLAGRITELTSGLLDEVCEALRFAVAC